MLINRYLNLNKVAGIYCILCTVNNKRYIGSSVNIRGRLATHFNQLRKNNHFNSHLQSAFNLYGKENFSIEILEQVDDLNTLIDREQFWINHHQAYNRERGFNWGECAKHPLMGIGHTEESKRKMSRSRISSGHKPTEKHKNKLSYLFKGKKLSKERCKKISDGALLGHNKEKRLIKLVNPQGQIIIRLGLRALCKEFGLNRAALSRFLLSGKHPNHKGWRLYEKGKIYTSIPEKRYVSPETCEKIRQSRLGRTFKKCVITIQEQG
jgi:group I intron endonuclease